MQTSTRNIRVTLSKYFLLPHNNETIKACADEIYRQMTGQENPKRETTANDPVINHMMSIGMFPNSTTRDLLETWREKHADEWIIKALNVARGKNQNYADKVLIGWEANGYPLTREQQIQSARKPQQNTTYMQNAVQALEAWAGAD